MNNTKKFLATLSVASVMSGVLLTSAFAQSPSYDDYPEYMKAYIGILTQNDWETLSMKEIDAKAKAAGKEAPYAGLEDFGAYALNQAQLEKLTDADWEKIHADYEKNHVNLYEDDAAMLHEQYVDYSALAGDNTPIVDEYAGVLTDDDWQTLSMKQIDDKLVAAGKNPVYSDYKKDPMYNVTAAEAEKFTEADWLRIDAEYAKIYPENN